MGLALPGSPAPLLIGPASSDAVQDVNLTGGGITNMTGMTLSIPATAPAGKCFVDYGFMYEPRNTAWEYLQVLCRVDGVTAGTNQVEGRSVNATSGLRRIVSSGFEFTVTAGAHTVVLAVTEGAAGTGLQTRTEFRRMNLLHVPV